MTDPSRIRIHGPLTSYVEGFAGRLAAQGYSERNLVAHLRLMAHVSRWLEAKHLSVEQLTPERRQAFATHRRAAGYRSACSALSWRPLLAFLEEAGVEVMGEPPTWLDRICDEYQSYLVSDGRCCPPPSSATGRRPGLRGPCPHVGP